MFDNLVKNLFPPENTDPEHINLLPDETRSIPSREGTDDSVSSLRNRSGTAIANKSALSSSKDVSNSKLDVNFFHVPEELSPKKVEMPHDRSFSDRLQDEMGEVAGETVELAGGVLSPARGGTYASALLMLKAVLGIGWIAIATSARLVGGGVVLGIIVGTAVGCYFSTIFIAECCIASKAWSYEEMVRATVPGNKLRKFFGFLTSAMLVFNQIGVLVANAIMISELLNILISDRQGNTILLKGFWTEQGTELGFFIMPFIIFLFVMPLSLFKGMNSIRHFVILAVFSMIFMAADLIYIIARYGVESSIKNAGTPWGVASDALDTWVAMNAISDVIFGLKFHQHLPQIIGEMADKKRTIHQAKKTGAYANTAGAIITATLAILGLYAFGWGPGPNYIQNLREFVSGDGATGRCFSRDVVAWIATILILLSTCCGYLIPAFTLRNSCNSIVKRIRGVPRNLPDEEDRQIRIFGTFTVGLGRLLDIVIAVVLQTVCVIIALVWNSFMSVVHYMGAIMGSYIIVWGPGFFVLFARAKYDPEFRLWAFRNWLPMAFVPIGLTIMVFGTIAAAEVPGATYD
jgi:proton-coupled amino acid transporter